MEVAALSSVGPIGRLSYPAGRLLEFSALPCLRPACLRSPYDFWAPPVQRMERVAATSPRLASRCLHCRLAGVGAKAFLVYLDTYTIRI